MRYRRRRQRLGWATKAKPDRGSDPTDVATAGTTPRHCRRCFPVSSAEALITPLGWTEHGHQLDMLGHREQVEGA